MTGLGSEPPVQPDEERREIARLLRTLERQREQIARLSVRTGDDARTLEALRAELNATSAALEQARVELYETRRRLQRVEGSVTWNLFQRARRGLFGLLGGESSRRVRALQRALRWTGRKFRTGADTARGSAPPDLPAAETPRYRIALDTVERPVVSIVMPVFAHAELTRTALESIRAHTSDVEYEVILVDDQADAATKELLAEIQGARVEVNDLNLGFLRSVNRGAAQARGRWLAICNNDIEVRSGWLRALLDRGESASDIAIVAPKYLYPDGLLAEAGSVVWRDGTGWNYGRGEEPTRCHYEFPREIDYGTAAALLVRADFWREAGGFDELFAPIYYEDTDLCFQAKERGFRVMYEPAASVLHIEGATGGIDEKVGYKRYQRINRAKFVEKWHERLEAFHVENDWRILWGAANRSRRPHVLIADHRVPTWDRDAGSLRMRGIIDALLELGCHVVVLPDDRARLSPYTEELQKLGAEVLYEIDLSEALRRIGPSLSLAILSRPNVAGAWLNAVRDLAVDAFVAYDSVDLHWLREARRYALEGDSDIDPAELPEDIEAQRELELTLIKAADATVVVSDEEQAQVLTDVPDAVIHVLPTVNPVRAPVPGFGHRDGVVFIASFLHAPNVDGALMLVKEVMPIVWERHGDVRVTIVGEEPPPEVQALAGPLVELTGWVPDIDRYIDNARALLAPLRYGAGIKGKVTQALAAGLPVVTTPIGAEGLPARDGEHLLIGSDAPELAERTIRVLTDAQLWQSLSVRGQQLAAEACSPAVMTERVRKLLEIATAPAQVRAGLVARA